MRYNDNLEMPPQAWRFRPRKHHAQQDEGATVMIPESGWQHADFENNLEMEFARTLDYYRIAWRYKPRTFAVEWDDEGNFVSSYTPTFYLFERDQYVELSTPGRAGRKVREVRLLRQNYPEISIILLSKIDFFIDEMADANAPFLSHLHAPENLADLAAMRR